MDGTGSGSCPVTVFGISGVELSSSGTKVLVGSTSKVSVLFKANTGSLMLLYTKL